MLKNKILQNPLVWITCLLPIVAWLIFPILPTFDDWSSTPGPNPDPFTLTLLLPQKSYWRPLESLYGWIIGHHRWLMPWFSHFIILTGHYIGTIVLYYITGQLGFRNIARNIVTVAFFVSTGAIATTTACDGMSQTLAHTLGLFALYLYLKSLISENRNLLWLIVIIFATIVKENAICWGVAIPIIGYSFNLSSRREMFNHALYGMSWAIVYTLIHFSIPVGDTYEINTQYFDFSMARFLRGVALWLTFSWLPLDYTHLLYGPNRNLFFVGLSVLCIVPFYLVLLYRIRCTGLRRKLLGLSYSAVILASPHLITIFSLMHVYSSLCIVPLIFGVIVNEIHRDRIISLTFVLFVAVSAVVNVEHCVAAKRAGEIGKRLSLEAINGVGSHKVRKTFLLIVDNGEKRYSNFYVLPWESFDWGAGIEWENHYLWPEIIDHKIIAPQELTSKQQIVHDLLQHKNYDCVWMLYNSKITTYLPDYQ